MLIRHDRAMLAITVMLDVAFHAGRANTVSATDIAERIGCARRGLEPLLQSLTRANLLESIRGPRGGYRLAAPARAIRLLDVAAVAIAGGDAEPTEGPVGALQAAVIDPLWEELDQEIRGRLAGVTVEDLLKRAARAGLCRPASDPITYVI
jgi:Rrf2 family protein